MPLDIKKLMAEGGSDPDPCKYCGRIIFVGPPCCSDLLYEMYSKVNAEVAWLRKVQSKQDKKIGALKKQLAILEGINAAHATLKESNQKHTITLSLLQKSRNPELVSSLRTAGFKVQITNGNGLIFEES